MPPITSNSEFVRFVQVGMDYREFLAKLAKGMGCERYFEVGVNTGSSIRYIDAASIGVDPEFRLQFEVVGKKPMLQLYQMTSDDFFAAHDLTKLFGGSFDLAFLDGMHHFEFLLRDFINTEPHAHKDSVVLLHDCFPVNAEMTERERSPRQRKDQKYRGLWTGDVWKLIPILKRFRPDLDITCTNCKPTGLAVIGNLDPKNTVLSKNYDAIVKEFLTQDMTDESIGSYFEQSKFKAPEMVLEAV